MWRYATDAGGRVVTFVEPGMLAKIGVNDRGLGVHFNFLDHHADSIDGGVPLHCIVRRILDEASSVPEAVELARSAWVGASSVVTVVSSRPGQRDAASVEISPAGVAAISPDADGWLAHTNHFLDPGLAAGEVIEPTSTSRARLAHLRSVLADDLPHLALVELAGRLCGAAGAQAPICVREDPTRPSTQQWRTLLTLRLDPQAGVVHYGEGSPAEVAARGGMRQW
jgi:isopenicillin-N N-acyltransferase-like protein